MGLRAACVCVCVCVCARARNGFVCVCRCRGVAGACLHDTQCGRYVAQQGRSHKAQVSKHLVRPIRTKTCLRLGAWLGCACAQMHTHSQCSHPRRMAFLVCMMVNRQC